LLALVFVPSSYLLVNRMRHRADDGELKTADQLPIEVDNVAEELSVV